MRTILGAVLVAMASLAAEAQLLTFRFDGVVNEPASDAGFLADYSGSLAVEIDIDTTASPEFDAVLPGGSGSRSWDAGSGAVVAARVLTFRRGPDSEAEVIPVDVILELVNNSGLLDQFTVLIADPSPESQVAGLLVNLTFNGNRKTVLDALSLDLPIGEVDVSEARATMGVVSEGGQGVLGVAIRRFEVFLAEEDSCGSVADVTTTNTEPGDPDYGVPDGVIDGNDLSYFVEQWLIGCP